MAGQTVLITGCSEGSLGAELAIQMAKAGYKVIATARNVAKMSSLPSEISKLSLDVASDPSIKNCVEEVRKITGGKLHILVNNAGARNVSPLSDLNIEEAKKGFDTNVWAPLAMSQAFLPLLLKAQHDDGKAIIANHTSIAAVTILPFQATYNAGKAALMSFTQTLRQELAPFGVQVVELRSGGVQSGVYRLDTKQGDAASVIPKGSLYEVAREKIDGFNRGEHGVREGEISAEAWAKGVEAVLSRSKLPAVYWSGGNSHLVWWTQCLPASFFEGMMAKMSGLDVVWKWAKGKTPKEVLS